MTELLMARVRGVVVEDGADCYERLTGKIAIETLTPGALIASRDFRKTHLDLAFGHVFSLLASIVGLVVLLPLLALIAVAIKLDSPGPVLFIQDRAGLGGRRIRLLKFRTMRPSEGPVSEWAKDNEHRVTRVGRWLRRYRLDELPQLDQRAARRSQSRRPAAAPDVERPAVREGDPVLLAAVGGASGPDRVGAGAAGLRERSRGRDREDALRPLLHQAHVGLARPAHHLRDRPHRARGRPRRVADRHAAARRRSRRRSGTSSAWSSPHENRPDDPAGGGAADVDRREPRDRRGDRRAGARSTRWRRISAGRSACATSSRCRRARRR